MTEDRTEPQWGRLATAIRAAREAHRLTQSRLAELAGVSEGTVQNLEAGKPYKRMPQSLARIEPHIGWAAGSGRLVLDGGDPIPVGTGAVHADPDTGKLRRKLPLRIVDELESDDPLLDSAVIRLPGSGGARMTVVVHGHRDATPEQIQEALLAWREAEERLQRYDGGGDDDEPQAAHGS